MNKVCEWIVVTGLFIFVMLLASVVEKYLEIGTGDFLISLIVIWTIKKDIHN